MPQSIKEICENNFTYADYVRFAQTLHKLERVYKVYQLNPECLEAIIKDDFEQMLDTMRVFDLQLRETFIMHIE